MFNDFWATNAEHETLHPPLMDQFRDEDAFVSPLEPRPQEHADVFALGLLPKELISTIFDTIVSTTLRQTGRFYGDNETDDEDHTKFKLDLACFRDNVPRRARQAITLSHISHDLRQLALATPSLWVNMFENMSFECVDAFTVRSGGCLLHVRIMAHADDIEINDEEDKRWASGWLPIFMVPETLTRLCELRARWGALCITGNVAKFILRHIANLDGRAAVATASTENPSLTSIIPRQTLPLLHTLIVANLRRDREPFPIPHKWDEMFAAWSMPRLKSFRSYVFCAIPTLHATFANVTHLGFMVAMPSSAEYVARSIRHLVDALFCRAFQRNLVELHLHFDPCFNHHKFGPEALPNLPITSISLMSLQTMRFTFEGDIAEVYMSVLELLSMPNLRAAGLVLPEKLFERALRHLANNSQSIQTLELMNCTKARKSRHLWSISDPNPAAMPLAHLFADMPSLQELTIKKIAVSFKGVKGEVGKAPSMGASSTSNTSPHSKSVATVTTIPLHIHDLTLADVAMRPSDLQQLLAAFHTRVEHSPLRRSIRRPLSIQIKLLRVLGDPAGPDLECQIQEATHLLGLACTTAGGSEGKIAVLLPDPLAIPSWG